MSKDKNQTNNYWSGTSTSSRSSGIIPIQSPNNLAIVHTTPNILHPTPLPTFSVGGVSLLDGRARTSSMETYMAANSLLQQNDNSNYHIKKEEEKKEPDSTSSDIDPYYFNNDGVSPLGSRSSSTDSEMFKMEDI